jgi:hypothetical protein
VVFAALSVLMLSAAFAVYYGLAMSSARHGLWRRLGGSLVAAIGVAGLYYGLALIRALF